MNSTPVSLLQRVCSGSDPAAWAEFVDVMLPVLWQWGRRLQLPEHDLEDIIQDVFLVLFRELPVFRYDPSQSFLAWLFTILKRRVLDWQRRKKPQSLDPAWELAAFAVPELEDTEFREWIMTRTLETIRAEFSEKTWRAFWEHTILDRPADAVAAELGIQENSVYVAKSRVLTVLRCRLKDMLD